jgi:hypothetical protein
MDVRIDTQPRGIAHAVLAPDGGQPMSARRAPAPPGQRTQPLFDANGNGMIENWSIAHGGDSFATFDPPPTGTTAAPHPKPHHSSAAADAQAAHIRATDHAAARVSTPAAILHAQSAYQRDGLGTSPAPVVPQPAAPPPRARDAEFVNCR